MYGKTTRSGSSRSTGSAPKRGEGWNLPAEACFIDEAEVLRLLGHPIRLKIVVGLVENACCVKDIWGCLDLPQAAVSQHLSLLRAHNIIRGEREGTSITYKVVNPFVLELVDWLRSRPDSKALRS
jgi:DNA-binding transcriptional ArsR family regulator